MISSFERPCVVYTINTVETPNIFPGEHRSEAMIKEIARYILTNTEKEIIFCNSKKANEYKVRNMCASFTNCYWNPVSFMEMRRIQAKLWFYFLFVELKIERKVA